MGKTAALPSADSLFGGPRKSLPPPAPATLRPAPPPPAAPPPAPAIPNPEQERPLLQALPPVAPEPTIAPDREKFTFRFDTATLNSLDQMWVALRGRTGRKIRKSWIVEALVRHGLKNPEKTLEILKAEMTDQMGAPTH